MPIEINSNLHFSQNWNGETSLKNDMSQYDTIGKIELIPASVLSTDKTNC